MRSAIDSMKAISEVWYLNISVLVCDGKSCSIAKVFPKVDKNAHFFAYFHIILIYKSTYRYNQPAVNIYKPVIKALQMRWYMISKYSTKFLNVDILTFEALVASRIVK